MTLHSWDLLLWTWILNGGFCEHDGITSASQISRQTASLLQEKAFVLSPSPHREVRGPHIYHPQWHLISPSSPDQMVGVVLLPCVFTVFLRGFSACCYLIFQTWVPSWPAGSLLCRGWANGKHAGQVLGKSKCHSFYFLVFSELWWIFFSLNC